MPTSKENVLLLFSGGKDSIISACQLIANNYFVHMLTCDNGCMSNVENAKETGERVIKRFGSENAKYAGIIMTAQLMHPLQAEFLYANIKDFAKEFPDIIPSQLNCLICHTAMYCAAIAYCLNNNITYMAEGARQSQGFFVAQPVMKRYYEELCKSHGITLLTPVYAITSDWKVKQLMSMWGFLPKTYEPQCWLGCPLDEPLNSLQITSLSDFYTTTILPKVEDLIVEMRKSIDFVLKEDANRYLI